MSTAFVACSSCSENLLTLHKGDSFYDFLYLFVTLEVEIYIGSGITNFTDFKILDFISAIILSHDDQKRDII